MSNMIRTTRNGRGFSILNLLTELTLKPNQKSSAAQFVSHVTLFSTAPLMMFQDPFIQPSRGRFNTLIGNWKRPQSSETLEISATDIKIFRQ